jgi:PAS domain S-box-containing protein
MNTPDDLQKAILNNIPDQAWLKDSQSHYILVNEAFIAACGLSESEILGKTPAQVWPADWGRKYIDTDLEVVRTGIRKRYEEWRHGEDGALRWFDTIKTPIRDAEGEVTGTAGISRDITGRKQAEDALSRLNRLYAVRSKTNQAIVRIGERGQLMRRVCQIAVKSGGLGVAWIGLFEGKEARVLRPHACIAGALHARRNVMRKFDVPGDPDLAKFEQPGVRHWVCNNASVAKRLSSHAQRAHQLGFSSFAVFQLRQDAVPVGVFVLYAEEREFFTKDIVQLLQAISSDVSFALNSMVQAQQRRVIEQELIESRAQLRELSAYLQSVREEERTRIARELHDELGQSLTAIRIGLDVIDTQQKMQGEQWLENIQSLRKMASSTIESVQRIAADLRPLILDELGLTAAIEWLLESFSEHAGILGEAILPPEPLDFDRETSTAIFRIVQESLTNIGRHSQASTVLVSLKKEGEALVLKVTDNGKGIAQEHQSREKSLGLVGMRERAYMLGGKLTIQSRTGFGTSIEVQIPGRASLAEER